MAMSYLEFVQKRKQQELEALEVRLRKEEEQLKLEYDMYRKAENKRIREENRRKFGENRNVTELRVIGETPVLLRTDDYSKVKDIQVVKNLDQLNHQQRNELYHLERAIFGRLQAGMTNFQVDEKLLSKAFAMRLEEFDELAGAFEIGRKSGFTDNEITQAIETSSSMEEVYRDLRTK